MPREGARGVAHMRICRTQRVWLVKVTQAKSDVEEMLQYAQCETPAVVPRYAR